MRYPAFVCCLVVTFSTTFLLAQSPTADLILIGGQVATMDPARPRVEAIAIKGERILAVGSNEEIQRYSDAETRKIDLQGKFLMPGFIEGHAHFLGLGQSMMMLNLANADTWDEIVEQVAEAAKVTPPGEWIVGRGWHQSKWREVPTPNVEGYPTDARLSELTPNHPVLLTHASGHMSFANGYAMRLAGVDQETVAPSGGEILRNESQQPIGVFRETAQALIARVRARDEAKREPAEQLQKSMRAIQLASEECLRKGVTSFQDAGSSFGVVDLLKRAANQRKLGVRLYVMIRDRNDALEANLSRSKLIGYGGNFLTIRAVKRSIDGALGPHGAWLLAPYEDLPSSTGLNTATIESVTRTAEIAIQNGFQVCVHAIGDRANREVLDIYEQMFRQYPSNIPRRWRIEHAQHLHPDDIRRFGELNVIAAMQGVHCTSDAVFVPKRLGMRRSAEGAYAWQSLLKSGAIVTNGTDAPVEDVDPLASFYASVTRQIGEGVTFFPEQKMTRMQALRSYTVDCAYAAFEETEKGSLVPGKLADLVVLSNDLRTCPDDAIMNTEVLYTIVGGKVVYELKEPEPAEARGD
ncbi:MAG: amidohydrolase [Planctomycetota bacterium]|nr:amidohydrolase [Planctomycetota bacterium]